jgi:hypothetical protein
VFGVLGRLLRGTAEDLLRLLSSIGHLIYRNYLSSYVLLSSTSFACNIVFLYNFQLIRGIVLNFHRGGLVLI